MGVELTTEYLIETHQALPQFNTDTCNNGQAACMFNVAAMGCHHLHGTVPINTIMYADQEFCELCCYKGSGAQDLYQEHL